VLGLLLTAPSGLGPGRSTGHRRATIYPRVQRRRFGFAHFFLQPEVGRQRAGETHAFGLPRLSRDQLNTVQRS